RSIRTQEQIDQPSIELTHGPSQKSVSPRNSWRGDGLGRTLRRCFALSFVLTLGWLGARPSRAEAPEPQLKLAVRTYNYAAVAGHILLNAEQHAAEIFHRAGID